MNTPASAGDVSETSYPEGSRERDPDETLLGDHMESRRQSGQRSGDEPAAAPEGTTGSTPT